MASQVISYSLPKPLTKRLGIAVSYSLDKPLVIHFRSLLHPAKQIKLGEKRRVTIK